MVFELVSVSIKATQIKYPFSQNTSVFIPHLQLALHFSNMLPARCHAQKCNLQIVFKTRKFETQVKFLFLLYFAIYIAIGTA